MESIGATQQGPDVLVSLFSIASAAGRLACGSVPDHFLQTRAIPRQGSRALQTLSPETLNLACGSVPDHFLQTRAIPRQGSCALKTLRPERLNLACGSVPDPFLQTRAIPRQGSCALAKGILFRTQGIEGFRVVQHHAPLKPAGRLRCAARRRFRPGWVPFSGEGGSALWAWSLLGEPRRAANNQLWLWLCPQDAVPHRCGRPDRSCSGAGQHVQGGAAVGRGPGCRLCIRLPLEPHAAPGWRGIFKMKYTIF